MRLKPINPYSAFGGFVGALTVYVFIMILDFIIEQRFDFLFFFIYWDMMFLVMILINQFHPDL